MIFITVGSRSFQFDRLLNAVDLAIENGEILDEVYARLVLVHIRFKITKLLISLIMKNLTSG